MEHGGHGRSLSRFSGGLAGGVSMIGNGNGSVRTQAERKPGTQLGRLLNLHSANHEQSRWSSDIDTYRQREQLRQRGTQDCTAAVQLTALVRLSCQEP